jgi:hypothetical protein
MPEEPARSSRKEEAIAAGQKLAAEILQRINKGEPKAAPEAEKGAGKDSELQEENRVLLNIVARLKEENDRLRKAVNAS